jgi:GntR family transcriptional regulator / MocR family aminotransferase
VPVDWANYGVDLHLDRDPALGSRRSTLERALREAIRAGRLPPRTRLPSTRTLAAELGLARGTVSAAYDQLVAEGYLSARTGSGTVVAGFGQRPAATAPVLPARVDPPGYDLRPGSPELTTFPTAAWLRAARRALAGAAPATYDYGDPLGHIELRIALAEYLGRARGVLTGPGQIIITSGYVQALALLCDVLSADSPAVIAMEDPGLSFHRDVVGRRGVRVVPLPVDARGARTDLLSTSDFASVRAAVVTPAHQYPLGVTLQPERRRAATAWASSGGGLLIEDDYDGEFRYDRQPVGALQGTAPEHVAYVGTASKTLAPALRLAWLVLPERLVESAARAKRYADMHTETLGQLTLAELIRGHGYDRHVRACRLRYRRRRDLLVERLAGLRGGRFAVTGIAAGLHATISLPPDGPDESAVLDHATRHDLLLTGLGGHWHGPGEHPKALIVGYGTPRESAYASALDTLAHVLATVE